MILYSNCFSQVDCKSISGNYKETIDTTNRPVYAIVEKMPDIMTSTNMVGFFTDKIHFIDSSNCFPIFIYYGFVVEKDCSISNVMICPKLEFCDDYDKIEIEEQKYINQLTRDIFQIKTNAGILNGKNVAVYTQGRIHFSPNH